MIMHDMKHVIPPHARVYERPTLPSVFYRGVVLSYCASTTRQPPHLYVSSHPTAHELIRAHDGGGGLTTVVTGYPNATGTPIPSGCLHVHWESPAAPRPSDFYQSNFDRVICYTGVRSNQMDASPHFGSEIGRSMRLVLASKSKR